jgi:hypothetical protein
MPERETLERVEKDAREGKSASTQAGEFVREEIHHIREGKHGARWAQQAIAIGLSKARRAGVKLRPPEGQSSIREKAIRKKAAQDAKAAKEGSTHKVSRTRSRAAEDALQHESRKAASHTALSRQATKSAADRGKQDRRRAAVKAERTRKAA